MKLGMNLLLWGVEVLPDHAPRFAALKEAGFDGVELPVWDGTEQQFDVGASVVVGASVPCVVGAAVASVASVSSVELSLPHAAATSASASRVANKALSLMRTTPFSVL